SPFIDMLRLLFFPEIIRPEEENYAMYFHYIVPAWFAGVVIAGSTVAWLFKRVRTRHAVSLRRIIIPALLSIAFFTAWSQEGTYFVYRLYETFPLLKQWRYLGRIL